MRPVCHDCLVYPPSSSANFSREPLLNQPLPCQSCVLPKRRRPQRPAHCQKRKAPHGKMPALGLEGQVSCRVSNTHIMPRNIMPVTQPILTHLPPSSARRQPAFGAMAACRAAASLSTRRCSSTSKNCRAWCHRATPVKEDRRMVHSCPRVESEECGQNCAWTS